MLDELQRGYQLEGGLMALFSHPNLGHASAQAIAAKLFNTPAAQSPWFLQELASAKEEVQAAANAGTVLAYFGKEPNKEVLAKRPLAAVMALCAGPYIEPVRIAKVAGSTDWLVRAAVARNPVTPPNLLRKLSADAHPLVAALACQSLAEPESTKDHGGAAHSAAGPINLDRVVTEILRRLRGEGFGWTVTPILNSAAWRDRAHLEEVLSCLKRFEEFDEWVQILLEELDDAHRQLFWTLGVSARDAEVRMRLAQHPAAPPVALERFASDASVAVLLAVAGRAKLPEKFRSKVEKATLSAVMRNSGRFVWKLGRLADDLPAFVRERWARDSWRGSVIPNPSFPDWMTQARNPGGSATVTGDRTVDDLGRDDGVEPRVKASVRRRLALEWMNCLRQAFHREVLLSQGEPPAATASISTADVLSALGWLDFVPASDKAVPTKSSRSSDWLSRLAAALHPGATAGILQLLRQDADPDVAAAAELRTSDRLAAPQPTA